MMTETLTWCVPSNQRMEYPPVNELVWTVDSASLVRRGKYYWEPGLPMPGGVWTGENYQPIEVKAWLFLEESPKHPPQAPLTVD